MLFSENASAQEQNIQEETVTQRQELVNQLTGHTSLSTSQLRDSFGTVPRHRFISGPSQALAYLDSPVPLGRGGVLPAPSELAEMIAASGSLEGKRILVAGPDSGYIAALVSRLALEVVQIEFKTGNSAVYSALFKELGYTNISIESGKSRLEETSPQRFDLILLAYGTDTVPLSLFARLNSTAATLVAVLSFSGSEQLMTAYRRVRNGVSVQVLGLVFFP